MIRLLLTVLSGPILDRLLAHLNARVSAAGEQRRIDASLAEAELRAEIEARRQARAVLIAESGAFLSAGRLGRLAFVLPLGQWWAAICLDSVFHFGWRIAEVPVLRDWGGAIVTSLFLVDGARSVVRGFTARGRA